MAKDLKVKHLAEMYVEGVRVSRRVLTLAEVREAFLAGFSMGKTRAAERCAGITRPSCARKRSRRSSEKRGAE